MKNSKVQIKGKKVFLNGIQIGSKSFIRSSSKRGSSSNGRFIFNHNNKEYRFDSSHMSYSKDADNYIKHMLESGQIDKLAAQSKELS